MIDGKRRTFIIGFFNYIQEKGHGKAGKAGVGEEAVVARYHGQITWA